MKFDLSDDDKRYLLANARESIASSLEKRQASYGQASEGLMASLGAFVSLHEHGRLRGCIGRMAADGPLYETIRIMACAAAFEDPRFPQVQSIDLPEIDIEISVLSPMSPVRPKDVVPGVHGVYLREGFRSGVFLPQVATEQGWDRETLLEELCGKAGLPKGSWRAPGAELFAFTALVFGERSLSIHT